MKVQVAASTSLQRRNPLRRLEPETSPSSEKPLTNRTKPLSHTHSHHSHSIFMHLKKLILSETHDFFSIFLYNFHTFIHKYQIFIITHSKNHIFIKISSFLDSILQDYAFRSFFHHRQKTGVINDGNVPVNLTGTTISTLRLRSGSLRKRGFHKYKEFDIPKGILVNPYVELVLLVYHNLGNWSNVYYPLPGFLYLSPVVGLLAYNAVNLTGKWSPELDLRSFENPILIKFETLGVLPNGVLPKCVFFDLFGGVVFDNVLNGSVCVSVTQGHFGVVFEYKSPAPAPTAPVPVTEDPIASRRGGGSGGVRKKGWWIGGSVAGGIVVAAVLVVVVLWLRWLTGKKGIVKMKAVAESGAPLTVAAVGRAKVPVAMGTRTKPILENEFVS